jgi:hypothetical protein
MSKQTRSKVPDDVECVRNAGTGNITHVRNQVTGKFGKVYSADQIKEIKAEAVRDYENSLNSFAWDDVEFIANVIND